MKKKNKKDILIRFSEEEFKMLDEIYNYLNTEENIRITKSFIVRYGIATIYKKIKNNELEERINKALEYMEDYIKLEPNDLNLMPYAVKCEFKEVIKLLKGADKE